MAANEPTDLTAKRRKQQALFQAKTADETRIRVQGSITAAIEEQLAFGDTVDIRVIGHVKRGVTEQHDSGVIVQEYVIKVDDAAVTAVGVKLPEKDEPANDDD